MSDESLMPLLTSARRERDTYRDAAVRGQKALEACEADRDRLKEKNTWLWSEVKRIQDVKFGDAKETAALINAETAEERDGFMADRDALLAVARVTYKYRAHAASRGDLGQALAALPLHLTRELE